jgi:predicted DNA-binding transcriptional regulator YafY
MATKNERKVSALFTLMERLAEGAILYPQDRVLQEEFGIDERSLRRYLEEIYHRYQGIVVTEKVRLPNISRRPITAYKVPNRERDVSRVLRFFMEQGDDLGWLLQLISENDPTLLKDPSLEREFKEHLENSIKRDARIFHIVGSPFENLGGSRIKQHFKNLRLAVRDQEYRRITHFHRGKMREENLKCLRLVFSDNNWYLAAEDESERFKFVRLAFIESIGYAKNERGEILDIFPASVLQKYEEFFPRIQNAMTLDVPVKLATLRTSPRIAHYFEKGMKPFFPSQRYLETLENGSIRFSVEYTQPLEILPFVKRWAPDLTVEGPDELRDTMIRDLREALAIHESDI